MNQVVNRNQYDEETNTELWPFFQVSAGRGGPLRFARPHQLTTATSQLSQLTAAVASSVPSPAVASPLDGLPAAANGLPAPAAAAGGLPSAPAAS